MYSKWYRGVRTPIELGNRLCKTATLSDFICSVGQAVCSQADVRLLFPSPIDDKEFEIMKPKSYTDQRCFYRLRPLSRALVMIVDGCCGSPVNYRVRLVRTGNTAGLSAPISFKTIEHTAIGCYFPDGDTIATMFETALEFVLKREARELRAGAFNPFFKELDSCPPDSNVLTQRNGYRSGMLEGPPSTWAIDGHRHVKRVLSGWIEESVCAEWCAGLVYSPLDWLMTKEFRNKVHIGAIAVLDDRRARKRARVESGAGDVKVKTKPVD
ncbi:hypothetical protein M501DRAFT_990036 [Patellaria atrata CBS 101060]|uniref:Uncharacterized protein n=1 Tax=Patellaria atrata CBS 101060 TaxID=1346257 RepID=A0A9P4SFF4_9PEZI|nr:hypothetical protein M501DRAFT_990036 [Patellaria atrata CBS 101060]